MDIRHWFFGSIYGFRWLLYEFGSSDQKSTNLNMNAPMNPNKALWEKGDFTRIAASMRESGKALVQGLGMSNGLKVDLGCGDGTTAIPAAKLGAEVLGVDIASNLVAAGNKREGSWPGWQGSHVHSCDLPARHGCALKGFKWPPHHEPVQSYSQTGKPTDKLPTPRGPGPDRIFRLFDASKD